MVNSRLCILVVTLCFAAALPEDTTDTVPVTEATTDEAVPPPMSEKEQKQHEKDVKEWELKMYDEVEKGAKRCDSYCENPCCQFATGHDTIEECGTCPEGKKCNPKSKDYGRQWKPCHGEL
eukprot:g904.t1